MCRGDNGIRCQSLDLDTLNGSFNASSLGGRFLIEWAFGLARICPDHFPRH